MPKWMLLMVPASVGGAGCGSRCPAPYVQPSVARAAERIGGAAPAAGVVLRPDTFECETGTVAEGARLAPSSCNTDGYTPFTRSPHSSRVEATTGELFEGEIVPVVIPSRSEPSHRWVRLGGRAYAGATHHHAYSAVKAFSSPSGRTASTPPRRGACPQRG